MSLTINDTLEHPSTPASMPTAIAAALAERFAHTAAARDLAGGTPKVERDLLRASGLLRLSIPKEYGGLGASWAETFAIVRQLTRAWKDSRAVHKPDRGAGCVRSSRHRGRQRHAKGHRRQLAYGAGARPPFRVQA